MRTAFLNVLLLVAFVGCGPERRNPGGPGGGGGGGGDVDAPPYSCTPSAENTPETCSDGMDNDCDGITDCADPNCSGIGSCPVCGMIDHPLSQPLPLPDGLPTNVTATTCTTDAQCANLTPAGQHCFEIPGGSSECRSSYIAKLTYSSFAPTQTFAAGNLQKVCVTMEHSWMRDLRIDLVAPSGQILQLQKMQGRNGGEVYLGQANDCDTDENPVPGTGAEYCWSPTATNPTTIAYADGNNMMLQAPNCFSGTADELPPGTYSAADPWTNLVGAMMNGDWQLRVTDLWQVDNGYIFKWSMTWDPSAVQDCSGPVIE